MTEWICSDSDSLQYYQKVTDFYFIFIEARNNPEGGYIVSSAPIDIQDYTIDELTEKCQSYYESIEDIFDEYGVKEGLRIIAECIFEQQTFDEMEFNYNCTTLREAEETIGTLMNSYKSGLR